MEHYATLLSFGPEGWSRSIAWGLLVTVTLAIATLPVGLVLGFLVALGKQSSEPSIRLASNIYTTIFRGLPELLTLFLVYFGASLGLQKLLALFGVNANVEINAFAAGMVITLSDIMRQTSIAARVTKEPFLFFGVACLLYLALAIISSYFINRIAQWADAGSNRSRGA
jgi:His/Glu/Gln/Arg/opine family amino acid ABC transporter permease subunit